MPTEHWLYTIPLGLRSLFRWAQADQELDDELRDHLERKTEEYVAKGMTQEEARRRADQREQPELTSNKQCGAKGATCQRRAPFQRPRRSRCESRYGE